MASLHPPGFWKRPASRETRTERVKGWRNQHAFFATPSGWHRHRQGATPNKGPCLKTQRLLHERRQAQRSALCPLLSAWEAFTSPFPREGQSSEDVRPRRLAGFVCGASDVLARAASGAPGMSVIRENTKPRPRQHPLDFMAVSEAATERPVLALVLWITRVHDSNTEGDVRYHEHEKSGT